MSWGSDASAIPVSPAADDRISWWRFFFGRSERVVWQWEHRTGWKNYDMLTSSCIEAAYLRGESYVRVKSGKGNSVAMELFFADMVQFDPKTRNTRPIRRHGFEAWTQKMTRRLGEWWVAMETGRPFRLSFEQYQKQRQAFLDDLEQKDFDRSSLLKSPSESTFARIACSGVFLSCSMLAVVANSLWLGYETDNNDAAIIWEAPTHFQVAEHFFCVFFTLELLIRFGAFKRKRQCIQDYWFVFDAVLVFLMVGETWIIQPIMGSLGESPSDTVGTLSVFRILRLLKLTRLTRFLRLVKFCPELLTMLKGIGRAMWSVLGTMILLTTLLYMFGILFKTQAEAYPDLQEKLPSVGESMWYLLLHGTFLDAISDEVPMLRQESPIMTVQFIFFVFFSHLTLLNMLVGILCEVVTEVTRHEREAAAIASFKMHLLPILEVHDFNNSGTLRKEEFDLLMRNPEMHMILGNLGVDAEDFMAMRDILFEDNSFDVVCSMFESDTDDADASPSAKLPPQERELSFAQFMETALRLRGGNQARVQDIAELREYVKQRVDELLPQILVAMQRLIGSRGGGRSMGAAKSRANNGGSRPPSQQKPHAPVSAQHDAPAVPGEPGAAPTAEEAEGLRAAAAPSEMVPMDHEPPSPAAHSRRTEESPVHARALDIPVARVELAQTLSPRQSHAMAAAEREGSKGARLTRQATPTEALILEALNALRGEVQDLKGRIDAGSELSASERSGAHDAGEDLRRRIDRGWGDPAPTPERHRLGVHFVVEDFQNLPGQPSLANSFNPEMTV